jgi:hypothetical protein
MEIDLIGAQSRMMEAYKRYYRRNYIAFDIKFYNEEEVISSISLAYTTVIDGSLTNVQKDGIKYNLFMRAMEFFDRDRRLSTLDYYLSTTASMLYSMTKPKK